MSNLHCHRQVAAAAVVGVAVGVAFGILGEHLLAKRSVEDAREEGARPDAADAAAGVPSTPSGAALAPADAHSTTVVRSPVYRALAANLHGLPEGPFADERAARRSVRCHLLHSAPLHPAPPRSTPLHPTPTRLAPPNSRAPEDHSYPHTNVPSDFLHALMRAMRGRLQSSYLLEIGSFKGGSALRIADAAVAALEDGGSSAPPVLVCVDTFLGDAGMWLDRWTGSRKGLLLEHGLPGLYYQFMANTLRRQEVVLPLPLASLCAIRALQHLAVDGVAPQPAFIYLGECPAASSVV